MGVVVVLITILVGLLSGLTAGLGRESTSAITGLRAAELVFGGGSKPDFASSQVTAAQAEKLTAQPGVDRAGLMGVATTRATAADHSGAVTAIGVDPAFAPEAGEVAGGRVVLTEAAADELGVSVGDRVDLGSTALTVAAVHGEASFSHTPVVWLTVADWQGLTGADGASVIAVQGATDDLPSGLVGTSLSDSRDAIGGYSSENGSLQLIRAFLFVISALVIGAFFTVWTIQRSPDIAVLKALGASTGYLLRDAVGQAVVLLVAGTALGSAIVFGVGLLAAGVVPFVLDLSTLALPFLVINLLGVVGAILAVRRVTSIDPLTALGSAR